MNYEEKYNIALANAEAYHNITTNTGVKNWLEYAFPELRESEDEKIRKAIICGMNALKEQHKETFASIPINDCIAYLEKQGEQKPIEQDTEVNDLWIYIREWNDKFGRLPKDEDELAACIDYVMKRQKPADKVEPKFKVGDWIVTTYGITHCIEKIKNNRVYVLYGGCIPIEDIDHIWSIEDAKDGDVLATKKGNPFIYDKYRYNNGLAYYYAGLGVNKELTLKSPYTMLTHFGKLCSVSPATQEQRDLLFQKMKESGYEWDAEKLELKKIEQKPTQKIEPFEAEHGKYYYCIKDYFHGGKKQASKGDVIQALRGLPIMGLKDASEYFLPVNNIQNHAWSEEDEEKRKLLISILEVNHPNGRFKVNPINTSNMEVMSTKELVNWLKSLKDRIQPKQEWSEEDESFIEDITNSIIENYYILQSDKEKMIDWLKSIKPNHWKPSEEQIGALNYAYCELFKRGENGEGNNCVHPLMTLIDDLKKL